MSPTQAEMDEVLRTMISDGRLTTTGVKLFAKNNRESRKSRKPTYEAAIELFKNNRIVSPEDFDKLQGFVKGDRRFRKTCIRHAEESLNITISKLSSPQRWVVEQNITELASEVITYLRGNGNRISKDKYAKSKSWSTVLARDVFKEVLSNDGFEEVSGGIIREAGA